MQKNTFIKLLEFFTGVFWGIAFFGGIACFLLLRDSSFLISLIFSLAFFGLFGFFGLLSKTFVFLLSDDGHKPL
ncbi:hypothetical protein BKH46_04980 [Helicobacter sp. 12S02634-8]|uniref:hypothetical protein n=1 Tax=Helicobacter sp. 12S02634-8 TaxID=1476199 RepID=UPI000BA557CA|nr:hypothetical protein [Helicobacter sp. 12S02634-8]PAF47076.1 hypothetical protein BKH46_04980 [Helicobacter sp. 12S02634-8]